MNGKANLVGRGTFVAGVVFLILGLPAQARYGGGSGTAEDPYLIATAEQMNTVGLNPEDWDKHFRLIADVDMNDLAGSAVHLIGPFRGVFDGDGHTIANLTCVVTGDETPPDVDIVPDFGLFRSIEGPDAVVKDLGLVNPDLRPDATCLKRVERVGALAGMLYTGSVRNCFVEGGHVLGGKYVGGLVGEDYGFITDCWSSAEVSGDGHVGGLAGKCKRPARTFRCYANGRVRGQTNVGGLVGTCAKDCSMDGCFAAGSVSAEQRVGGLVGYHEGSISRCHSTAFVSAGSDVGGLVGFNGGAIRTSRAGGYVTGGRTVGGLVGLNLREDLLMHYNPIVADSYATGRVRGDDVVGGLVGQNAGGVVLRCYSTGPVTGLKPDAVVGGLPGANSDVPIEDSFWDTVTSGLNDSHGGIGKTTAEMQDMSTYVAAGWDFEGETFNGTDDLWKMWRGGPNYPKLAWEPGLE